MRRLIVIAMLVTFMAEPLSAQISLLGLRNSLIQFALARISTPDSFEITAEGVEDSEEGLTELVGVRIADAQGVWLEMDALGLRWNARRILRGELEINRLNARGVRVLRRPEPAGVAIETTGEPAPREPFAWPRAPITTRVDQIELVGVSIAPGVLAAQSLAFDAEGAARDEGNEQSARLALRRTDDVEGVIDFDYLRDFAADTLTLKLAADEAPGGLVAELAGLPDDARSTARIDAEGPLSDWRMTFAAEAEQMLAADGSAVIVLGPPLSIAFDARAVPGPAAPQALRAALSPEARLAARVTEGEGGRIEIEQGEIRSPELSLDADGFFNRDSGALDLTVNLVAGGGLADLVDGVAFERFAFDGAVTGALDDLTARGALALDGLETGPVDVGAARFDAVVTVAGQTIGVVAQGSAERMRLDRIGPDLLDRADLSLQAGYDGSAAVIDHIRLTSQVLTLGVEGALDVAGQGVGIDYAVSAPSLAPIASRYDVDAGGRFEIAGRVDGALSAPLIIGSMALRDMTFGTERLGDLELAHEITLGEGVQGRLSLEGDGSRLGALRLETALAFADQRLTLTDFAGRAEGLRLSGRAEHDFDGGLTDAEFRAAADDFGLARRLADLDIDGRLTATVALSHDGARQAARIQAEGLALKGFGAAADALRIEIETADALAASPDAVVALTADAVSLEDPAARLGAARLTARLTDLLGAPRAEGEVALSNASGFDAALRGLEGRFAVVADPQAPTFDFAADLTDLAAAGVAMARARVESALTQDGAETLTATVRAPAARLDAGTLGALALDATVTGPRGDNPTIAAQARLGASQLAGVAIASAGVRANGPLSALALSAEVAGADAAGQPLSLNAAARADLVAATPTATISRFDAALGDLFARLDQPARLTLAPGATGLTNLALSLPGGGVSGRATLHANGLAGDLAVRLADIAPLATAAGQDGLAGAVEADARFDTRPGAATADVRLRGRGLSSDALILEQGQGFDVDAGLDWRRGVAAVELSAAGPMVERPLRVEASVPLRATGGLLPQPARGAPVSGSVDWRGRIGDLWALAPAADHVLDGDVTIALTFSGPIEGPDVSGELSLRDGLYQNLDLGTIVTNLTAQSQIDPDGAFAITLQGDDGAGRPITGRARLSGGQIDARVTTDQAVLVRRDDVTAAISADIAIAGPLAGPTVSGPITVNRAEVRLVNTTPPGVDDIGPIRIKGEPPPPPPDEDGGAIALDMTVRAPGNIFVRGRGLDSEWRMDLRIGGGAAAPRVTGAIERVRGQLSLVGAIFNLDRGEVRFGGGPTIDPTLDVALIRDAGDVRGGIVVDGPASNPAISFQSTPALPEGEVLPRVLFGKSQQSLTPAEALQLASGLATLFDGSGGLLDGVRDAVGLDVLRLEGLGEDATVTVGRNVAEGVFVGARQPIDGGSASVTVEIEVFDNVIVDTEVGAQSGSSFGLNWKRDF